MHCYTASRGTTALQREISLKTKMLLRDFSWGLTKSCVGSDWLQGGLCSKHWKPFGSTRDEAERGRAELGFTAEFTCVRSVCWEQMSSFWNHVVNVSSRHKTTNLLLSRRNPAVKGWGVFDFYTNTQQFITNVELRPCAEQGNPSCRNGVQVTCV